MIFRLLTQGSEEFKKIFFSDLFEEPNLIWNKNIRERVMTSIRLRVFTLRENLICFSQNKNNNIDHMPRFEESFLESISHEEIEVVIIYF